MRKLKVMLGVLVMILAAVLLAVGAESEPGAMPSISQAQAEAQRCAAHKEIVRDLLAAQHDGDWKTWIMVYDESAVSHSPNDRKPSSLDGRELRE